MTSVIFLNKVLCHYCLADHSIVYIFAGPAHPSGWAFLCIFSSYYPPGQALYGRRAMDVRQKRCV